MTITGTEWQARQRCWFAVYVGLTAAFWALAWAAGGELNTDTSRVHVDWQGALINLALLFALSRGWSWAWFLLMAWALLGAIFLGWDAAAGLGPSLVIAALISTLQLVALWSMQARDPAPVVVGRFHESKEEE